MVDGKNIFEYYNTDTAHKNVTDIKFAVKEKTPAQTGFRFAQGEGNDTIALDEPLAKEYLDADMQYTIDHVNGEEWTSYFTVRFQNPFVSGDASSVTLNGNAIGEVTAPAAPQVVVNDLETKAIYKWDKDAQKLVLTKLATDSYKVAEPTVKYAFDETTTAYKTFVGNLDPKATFEVDPATGVITYDNLGATLVPSYTLSLKATVTFADLSVVVCKIPVVIKGQNN